MKLGFDRKSNVALIQLIESPAGAQRDGHTWSCDDPHARGLINLEFDKKGRLTEIEVMDAARALPAEALETAERWT